MLNTGDRVKIKSVFGKLHNSPAIGFEGVVKGQEDERYLIETYEHTLGHYGHKGSVEGKQGHCWWVDESDVEVLGMEGNRSDVAAELYRWFVRIEGIGPEMAKRCAEEAVRYLDGLVASVEGNAERDEDGIKWMARPEGFSTEWSYFSWRDGDRRWVFNCGWLFNCKPILDPSHVSENWFIYSKSKDEGYRERSIGPSSLIWKDIPNGLPLEERIVRFYD